MTTYEYAFYIFLMDTLIMSPSIKKFAGRAISPSTRLACEKVLGRFRVACRLTAQFLHTSSCFKYDLLRIHYVFGEYIRL